MIPLDLATAKNFLNQNKIFDYEIKMIAGDASFRSYYRIFCQPENLILMFAPPTHEDIAPFIKIDEFLVKNNFSAPKIFAIDVKEGFILLEDFGDVSYSRHLAQFEDAALINQELEIYKKACDCLIHLHEIAAPKDVTLYNNELLFREVMLFIDWYLLHVKKITLTVQETARYKALWFDLFDLLNRENQVLVLRDYHADNLMLIDRSGHKAVGLLDFQDAVIGCKAYDLVSLLEDARRDLDENNRQGLLQYYLREAKNQAKIDKKSFLQDYAILSLQRNIKIIGIFARLANRDSKPHYLKLLPRVINFVTMRLDDKNPIFNDVAQFLKKYI